MSGSPVSEWIKFFKNAGLAPSVSSHYATIFVDNRMRTQMLPDLTKDFLKDMGINAVGDIIAILKHSKAFYSASASSKLDTRSHSDDDSWEDSSTGSGVQIIPTSAAVNPKARTAPVPKRKTAVPTSGVAKKQELNNGATMAGIKRTVGGQPKKLVAAADGRQRPSTAASSARNNAPTFPAKKRTLASDAPAKPMAKARIQAQNTSLHDRFSGSKTSGGHQVADEDSESESESNRPVAKAPRMTPAALLFAKRKELESQKGKSVSASILSRLKLPSDSPRSSPKPVTKQAKGSAQPKGKESDTAVFRRLDGSKEKVVNFKVQIGNESTTTTTKQRVRPNATAPDIADVDEDDYYYDEEEEDDEIIMEDHHHNHNHNGDDDQDYDDYEEELEEDYDELEEENDEEYNDDYDEEEEDQEYEIPTSRIKLRTGGVGTMSVPVRRGVLGGRISIGGARSAAIPSPPEPRDALKYGGVLKSPSKPIRKPIQTVKARLGVKQRLGTPARTSGTLHSDQDAAVSSTTADVGSLGSRSSQHSRKSALARLGGVPVVNRSSKFKSGAGVLAAGRIQLSVKHRLGEASPKSSGSARPKITITDKQKSVFNRLGRSN